MGVLWVNFRAFLVHLDDGFTQLPGKESFTEESITGGKLEILWSRLQMGRLNMPVTIRKVVMAT